MAEIYAARGKKSRRFRGLICHRRIHDVPVAEGKLEIQPDSVPNNHGWKAVSGIGDFLHPATLRRHQ